VPKGAPNIVLGVLGYAEQEETAAPGAGDHPTQSSCFSRGFVHLYGAVRYAAGQAFLALPSSVERRAEVVKLTGLQALARCTARSFISCT
jgi:hypothetical protein